MQENKSLKIAIAAAEIAPYAKVGGLADVIGALPAALKQRGAEVSVVIPGYRVAMQKLATERVGADFKVEIGGDEERFDVLRAAGPGGVSIYLIDHPEYFGREGLYGDRSGDYPDNLRRFIFFGRAAAEALARLVGPDVVHAHDWHASVLPIVMRADHVLRRSFNPAVSVFTIHNLAFQGICEPGDFPLLNLDWSYFSIDCLEFYGRVNLMKGAVALSDAASTVSPSYAREVTSDPELGFGLEGVLAAKHDRFVGILNGADYNEWNPATDRFIAAPYGSADFERAKSACAKDLRDQIKLKAVGQRPMVGMVTRMTPQKGFDLLARALESVLALELQLVILGSGDQATETLFKEAERRHPDRLRVVLGFDNALAHKIQAGCDMFLMPSRFEPCGLTQMYALKYGTVPVVRATGGLADTVSEFDPETGRGDGFVFHDYLADGLVGALGRALAVWGQPVLWRRLISNCFAADFSWNRAAGEYLGLFERIRGERPQS